MGITNTEVTVKTWTEGKDWHEKDESKLLHTSSASSGSTDWQMENIKKSYFWKRRVCVAIFFYVTFSFATSSEQTESRRVKRQLKLGAIFRDGNEKISTEKPWEKINRRSYHRYGEKESRNEKNLLKQMHEKKPWSPRPFEPKAEKQASGNEDAKSGQKAEKKREFEGRGTKGSVSSVRLKGIHMLSVRETDNYFDEKLNYSQEINDLMQSMFDWEVEGTEGAQKKSLKDCGAPSQRSEIAERKRPKTPKLFLPNRNREGRLMTIYLNFHAIEDCFRSRKSTPTEKRLPHEEGRGMIMKLNLYPSKGGAGGHAKKFFGHNKEADRKSFGWFSKHKKKETNHAKGCSLMSLNTAGKHITAKWKKENGNRVHAKAGDGEIF